MSRYGAAPDEHSAPFFAAAAQGRLLIRRCARCGEWLAPYSFTSASPARCTSCGGRDLDWVQSSGRGELVSWTVVHVGRAGEAGTDRRGVGVMELAEGPWLFAPLAGEDRGVLRVGAAMVVDYERVGGGEPVPVLRTAG